MRRKNVLMLTMAVFVMLILSGIGSMALQIKEETTVPVPLNMGYEINVEKKVWDVDHWDEETQVYSGETVTFNLTVKNTGTVALFDIYVNDTLPDGVVYETGSATVNGVPMEPTQNENLLTWYFPGKYDAGNITNIEFDATAYGQPCTYHTNWVDAAGKEPCGTPHEDSDSASVRIGGMGVEKTVRDPKTGKWVQEIHAGVGGTVRFNITIRYCGGYTLYNIKVRDELPECLEYAGNANIEPSSVSEDGRTIWWNLSSQYDLHNGESRSIEFDADITHSECETVVNIANVTARECSGATFYGEDSAAVHIECLLTADAGGPYYGDVNKDVKIEGSATGGSPDYNFSWDLNNDGKFGDATGKTITCNWSKKGTYTIWLKVIDADNNEATDYGTVTIVGNDPPLIILIGGPSRGKPGIEYTYSAVANDPDGDQVYYWFNWGDGTNSGWVGPYASGATGSAKHTWTAQGTYNIKVKAKDIHGLESDWVTFSVIMPTSYSYPDGQSSQSKSNSQPSTAQQSTASTTTTSTTTTSKSTSLLSSR